MDSRQQNSKLGMVGYSSQGRICSARGMWRAEDSSCATHATASMVGLGFKQESLVKLYGGLGFGAVFYGKFRSKVLLK